MSGNRYYDSEPPLKLHDAQGLTWRHDLGMGYLPLQETPYDADYFEKYVGYEKTKIGIALNDARFDLVEKWFPEDCGSMVDVGIGSGQFMRTVGCYGFDVNPVAIDILNESGLFFDPYVDDVDCATFFDSLEHIQDIAAILAHVKKLVLVSIPIYENLRHALASMHFRPDEHCWYHRRDGFIKFMAAHGFEVVHRNDMESEIGREGIETFVCKRIHVR